MKSISNINNRTDNVSFFVITLLVFCLSFFQVLGEAPDWQSYEIFFDYVRTVDLDKALEHRFEPFFIGISYFLTGVFSSNLLVFSIIASGAIYLKVHSINVLSLNKHVFFIATLFYLIRFLPLLELTQIRAAVAASFMFLAFTLALRGNLIGVAVSAVTAYMFHSSTMIVIPFLLVFEWSIRHKYDLTIKKLITIIVVTLVTLLVGIDWSMSYFQDSIQALSMYQTAGFGEEQANPLSVALLLDWMMIIVNLIFWKHIPPIMKYILLFEIIGMLVFYTSFSNYQVIAHRLREFISVFWCFFIIIGLQQKYLIKYISIAYVIANYAWYFYIYAFRGFFS